MWNSTHEYRASVLINGRKPAPEVEHQGSVYIEGRDGSTYGLELENRSPVRILVIPSVDGLSVLDGKPAGVNSPGYIVERNEIVKIPGWKVDSGTAAEFVFGSVGKGQNYAEQTGQDERNQGVIGFLIFRERVVYQSAFFHPTTTFLAASASGVARSFTSSSNIASANMTNSLGGSGTLTGALGGTVFASSAGPAVGSMDSAVLDSAVASAAAPEAGLGTGWSEATEFKTHVTSFTREHETIPNAVLMLYYDTIRNLRAMGVPVERFKQGTYRAREAFPASPYLTNAGATPPPGWNKGTRRKR